MQFSSDLLDKYAEREGYADWEIIPVSEESNLADEGDLIIRFIREEDNHVFTR